MTDEQVIQLVRKTTGANIDEYRAAVQDLVSASIGAGYRMAKSRGKPDMREVNARLATLTEIVWPAETFTDESPLLDELLAKK